MIKSVGEIDYSAQETCHLLLQLPMYRASQEFFILSLDGSRQDDDRLEEGNERATLDSQIDHYCARPHHMEFLTLLEFVQRLRTPKTVGDTPTPRKKDVIVIVRPYCSPDPCGPHCEDYCRHNMTLYQPFRKLTELLGDADKYSEAYSVFVVN